MRENNIILSICIPSYNRFWKLEKNLTSILNITSQKIEVVVSDNCSDENLDELNINDPRVKFIKREMPVHPNENIWQAIRNAAGKYVMVCLDKDILLGKGLEELLELLEKNSNISCGSCELNSKNMFYKIIKKPFEKYAYCIRHPSGCFMRRDIMLRELDFLRIEDANSIYYRNPFQMDFILAASMKEGAFLDFKKPLVLTETSREAVQTKSYTYSNKQENIFFFPQYKASQLELFFIHLKHVENRDIIREKMKLKLCRRFFQDCTWGYYYHMKDEAICKHYMLESHILTCKELKDAKNVAIDTIDNAEIAPWNKIYVKNLCELLFQVKYIKMFVRGEIR